MHELFFWGFFTITLRQDVCSFSDIAQMKESNSTYLFNVHAEGHILVKKDSSSNPVAHDGS